MSFPKEIFVTVELEGTDDEIFFTGRTLRDTVDFEDGRVAIYELKKVQNVTWEPKTEDI